MVRGTYDYIYSDIETTFDSYFVTNWRNVMLLSIPNPLYGWRFLCEHCL